MKIYLAGPIFQCDDHECIDWREIAKKLLTMGQIIDPMDRDYRGQTDENYQQIVDEDKMLINQCDILLVNHDRPSVGTSMEVLYAWERDKHVVSICPNGAISPWMLYHSHKICHTLEEAVEYINSDKSEITIKRKNWAVFQKQNHL